MTRQRASAWRTGAVLGGAAILLFSAGAARAQETGRVEVGIFAGGYFGSRISLTPQADVRIGKDAAFGLRGAYLLDRHFGLELTYSRSSPGVAAFHPTTGVELGSAKLDETTLELNLIYNYGSGRVRGYFGLGAGAMTLRPLESGTSDADTRAVFNATMGVKYFLTNSLALRLDGRYRWRVTNSHVTSVICLEETGCGTYTSSLYSSGEVTGGVSYRFGNALADDLLPAAAPSASSSSEPQKNFGWAAGSLVAFDLIPWAFNRYVTNADFAYISTKTVEENFRAGFGFDRDAFKTNQYSHPFHGNLFFNAGRSNGYNFWESGVFAFTGSFLWECCLEKEPPAINDLVNTTLGGMTRGEVLHRLSTMLWDNTKSGSERMWREIGGGVLNPVGGLNRLLKGETGRDFPNPDDRFPSRFILDGDIGYRHVGGDTSSPNQVIGTVGIRYGDPWNGDLVKPFQSFITALDVNVPGVLVSRVEQRGVLRGWELSEKTASNRHIFGIFMEYEYLNNQAEVWGAQIFSTGLLSRFQVGSGLSVVTSFTGRVFPLAGFDTTNELNPITGRTFDYAPGGGLRGTAGVISDEREVLSVGYGVDWAATADGTAKNSTFQFFRALGRFYFSKAFGAGAGYSWYHRLSTYDVLPSVTKSQNEWRVFLSWNLL